MSTHDSRAEYTARIHRVLEHIDRHLDQPLELPGLAQVAHFSPFHFHRLFAAWMGETLGDYLRRRRLEVAATRLMAQPRLALLQVALAVGFGSGEAFSRAFKGHFGASPSAWRSGQLRLRQQPTNSNPGQVQRKLGQAPGAATGHDEATSPLRPVPGTPAMNLNVQLIDREPVPIAYLRHTGPYGAPIGRFWHDTVAPWMAANQLLGKPRYGISHDDPSVSDPQLCRYDAGVEVPAGTVLSGEPLRTVLPGGRYAVLAYEGRSDQIDATWRMLLRDWLPDSGLQLDNRPCFEHYPADARYDESTGVFSCGICIAVAPL